MRGRRLLCKSILMKNCIFLKPPVSSCAENINPQRQETCGAQPDNRCSPRGSTFRVENTSSAITAKKWAHKFGAAPITHPANAEP